MGAAVLATGPAAVATDKQGRTLVWLGEEGDAVVLGFDPVDAIETARRILRETGYSGVEDKPPTELQAVEIMPAASASEPAQLVIRHAKGEIRLLIDLRDLTELAETARRALLATPAAGRS